MLDVLRAVEIALPKLLCEPASSWQTLMIDYEKPHVERVWRQSGEYRICLHRIHPCREEDAFLHPHAWPMASRILDGTYREKRATGLEAKSRPPFSHFEVYRDASHAYEMVGPLLWHSVQPIEKVCMTLMVIGTPWHQCGTKSPRPLQPLSSSARDDILAFFRTQYRA